MNDTTNIKTTLIRSLFQDTKKSKDVINSLKSYMFIHNVSDLNTGSHIRWIDLTKSPYTLQNVVCLINVEILDTYVSVVCKTFTNKYFKKRYDDLVIFRKQ
jgi:hypothetical protein